MKKIPLTPYPGQVLYCKNKAEFLVQFAKIAERPYDGGDNEGTTASIMKRGLPNPTFLIHAKNVPTRAHELSHAILTLFEHVGIDPCEGDGEPFCYMMSHLMEQTGGR